MSEDRSGRIMQIKEVSRPGLPLISGYGPGSFSIAEREVSGPVLVTPERWAKIDAETLDSVTEDTLQPLFAADPAIDILIVGTGAKMGLVPPALRAAAARHGLSVEPMDSGAAARTFNVLLLEDRRVAALLFPV